MDGMGMEVIKGWRAGGDEGVEGEGQRDEGDGGDEGNRGTEGTEGQRGRRGGGDKRMEGMGTEGMKRWRG